MKTCAILGIGTALPRHAITQAEAAKVASTFCCLTAEQARQLSVVYRRAGVSARYMAMLDGPGGAQSFYPPAGDPADRGPTTGQRMNRYDAEVRPLAQEAARRALDSSGLSPRDITHLVTVSCTGFAAPGIDIGLIEGLELHRTTQRTHVGFMGCHGALNGLQVARAICGSDAQARVLLCAVEICSLHFQYGWDPDQIVASALFADGAASVVLVPADAEPASWDPSHPNPSPPPRGRGAGVRGADAWRLAATGSCLLPDSADAMTWRIGDHGFEMTLATRVPDLIHEQLRPWVEEWLAENGLRLTEIGSWAVHPGGPRILSAVAEVLELPQDALAVSRAVLAERGNMSSATVLFILDRLMQSQSQRPSPQPVSPAAGKRGKGEGRPCVALGFGPGLVAEAALFQ